MVERTKQLRLFDENDWEIQSGEKLATTPVPNSAREEVTNLVKPEEGRDRAITQVKVLNSEIRKDMEADTVNFVESSMAKTAKGEGLATLSGSKAMARDQRDNAGTGETRDAPRREVCTPKPIDGKAIQKASRESDQPIVPEKSRNGDRGKGLAGIPEYAGETASALRGGKGLATPLATLTQRARRNPRCQFTSLAHLLTEGFLRGCLGELKKDKAPGIDGVTVKDYEVHLEENLQDLVERLKGKKYRPQPVRRVYIPKANGEKRPLGIPTLEDKVVQMGGNITIEAESQDNSLIVSVMDQGIGMTREDIDKIFDRFFRAEPAVSGKTQGTGLGLSICRGIVEAHNGKIWVESSVGKGTTFSFSIPLSLPEKQISIR